MARGLALRGLMLDEREPAGFLLARIDHNAVVAAIGTVNKFAGRMHIDLRRAESLLHLTRHRADGLEFLERPA